MLTTTTMNLEDVEEQKMSKLFTEIEYEKFNFPTSLEEILYAIEASLPSTRTEFSYRVSSTHYSALVVVEKFA